jgi:hypothetical protein
VIQTRAAAIAVALLLSASCAHGLAFVQDRRIEVVAPRSHATVTLPVTVRWRVKQFRITGPDGASDPSAGYFGVFVDQAPVPPGKTLAWIARDDRRCRADEGCPDAAYLANHDVYTTTQTAFTLPQLPDLLAYHGNETHEVTIVLLNGRGIRVGESAWYIDFRYQRPRAA